MTTVITAMTVTEEAKVVTMKMTMAVGHRGNSSNDDGVTMRKEALMGTMPTLTTINCREFKKVLASTCLIVQLGNRLKHAH